MVFDLLSFEEQRLPHFREGEGEFLMHAFCDDKIKIMRGKLEPGSSIGLHCHMQNSEVIFLQEGIGTITMTNGSVETLLPGSVHYCPMGQGHSLKNNGTVDLVFLAVIPEHH